MKTEEKDKQKESGKRAGDLNAPGKGIVKKVDSKIKTVDSKKPILKIPKLPQKKEKEEIVKEALDKHLPCRGVETVSGGAHQAATPSGKDR